jgi:hypothetical protein
VCVCVCVYCFPPLYDSRLADGWERGGHKGSYAETLAYLLATLRRPDRTVAPLVVILNEFDQFANHGRQALLYNMLDTVQSHGSPLAVIGITCRLVRGCLCA